MSKHWLMLSFLPMLVFFSGCTALFGEHEQVEPIDPQALQILMGADWQLFAFGTEQNPRGVVDGTSITINFSRDGNGSSGTISGSAGCNSYGGSYTITGGTLEISQLHLTKIYCAEPIGVMEQESEFINALQSARSIQVWTGQLNIRYGERGETLFFVGALQ